MRMKKPARRIQAIYMISLLSGLYLGVLLPALGKAHPSFWSWICLAVIGLSGYGLWRHSQAALTFAALFELGLIVLCQLLELKNAAPLPITQAYIVTTLMTVASGYGLFGDFSDMNADDICYPFNRF